LARERDYTIERLALIYLRSIALLAEDGQKASIRVENKPRVVTSQDLDAKFKIIALDQASTPVSAEINKQNLVNLAPLLIELGVAPEKVKEELIRLFGFPETFLEAIEQPPAPPVPAEPPLPMGAPQMPPMPTGGAPSPTGEGASLEMLQALAGEQ
jgi:hypothetical protein